MDNLNEHIERYLKGELTPAEMRELEMKALHDPFLADALEGAESLAPNEFTDDVHSINKKVRAKGKNPYIWPLSIAASILLVTFAYFIVRQSDSDLNSEQLALQKQEATEEPSVVTGDDSLESKTKVTEIETAKKKAENISPLAQEKPDQLTAIELPKPDNSTRISQHDDQKEKDIMVDSKDADEMSMVAEAEETKTQPIEELKSEPATARMKSLKKNEVQPRTLSGAGATQGESKSSIVEDRVTNPDESYQKYLKANVEYPKVALDNNVEGTVTITFDVDPNGNPTDFKIVKGIGYGCDEELIRVIKEGPSWSPTQERKVISFTFQINP